MFGLLLPPVRLPVALSENCRIYALFHMLQFAYLQPILKYDKEKSTLISCPKTEVNHGVENDAG